MADKIYNNQGEELNVGGSGTDADELRVGTFNSSYNETDVATKRSEFCSKILGKDKIETFLYFTDPHLAPNSRAYHEGFTEAIRDKYISALQKYYNSLPLDFCLCGGDWLNYHASDNVEAADILGYSDSFMRKLFKNYHSAMGNHDDNPRTTTVVNQTPIPIDSVIDLMFRQEKSPYYSFDGLNSKWYVMNSGTTREAIMTDHDKWAQVAWLADKLSQDDADVSVVVMHAYSNGITPAKWYATPASGNQGVQPFGENIKTLVNAYNGRTTVTLNGNNYNFAGCEGHVAFILCGHSHFDFVDCDGDFPVVNATDLEGSVVNGNSTSCTKVPTFDCCMMDIDNDVLYMTRIGTGKNRYIHYVARPLSVGSTLQLTSQLAGTKFWQIQSRVSGVASVSNGTVTGLSAGYAGVMAYNSTTEEYWIVKVS
jgi:hypothetical protein